MRVELLRLWLSQFKDSDTVHPKMDCFHGKVYIHPPVEYEGDTEGPQPIELTGGTEV